ncbi:MAG: acyl carrier protein [Eggerthellaceae bacterium]|nr:acyl carrier protein [Eggerthellaceae bacterium]
MDQKFIDLLNKVNEEIFDNPDADLVEDGVIDSLDIMNLVAGLEQVFEVDFDPDDILPENFASPKALWELVRRYQAEG